MSRSAPRHVRIFLASPGDVVAERQAARELLQRLQHEPLIRRDFTIEPVSWDDPAAPAPMLATLTPQQAVALALPAPSECDLTILMLWGRIGTPLDERRPDGTSYASGSEWEFEDARRAGRPILVYRRIEALPPPQDEETVRQRRGVERFFEQFAGAGGTLKGGYATYDSVEAFTTRLRKDVESQLASWRRPGRPRFLRPALAALVALACAVWALSSHRPPADAVLAATARQVTFRYGLREGNALDARRANTAATKLYPLLANTQVAKLWVTAFRHIKAEGASVKVLSEQGREEPLGTGTLVLTVPEEEEWPSADLTDARIGKVDLVTGAEITAKATDSLGGAGLSLQVDGKPTHLWVMKAKKTVVRCERCTVEVRPRDRPAVRRTFMGRLEIHLADWGWFEFASKDDRLVVDVTTMPEGLGHEEFPIWDPDFCKGPGQASVSTLDALDVRFPSLARTMMLVDPRRNEGPPAHLRVTPGTPFLVTEFGITRAGDGRALLQLTLKGTPSELSVTASCDGLGRNVLPSAMDRVRDTLRGVLGRQGTP